MRSAMDITIDVDKLALRSISNDLSEAARRPPNNHLDHLLVEWPELKGACNRLARLTAGLRIPAADGDSLLVRALELGCEASGNAADRGVDTLAAFVLAVSRKVTDILHFNITMKVRGSWSPWDPMEDYLLDEMKRRKAVVLRIQSNPQPPSTDSPSRLILASRVFSLSDLVRAGVLHADVTKSAA